MRIVLTGGGTAGHLLPFEPLIEMLRIVYREQRQNMPVNIAPSEFDIIFAGIVDARARELFGEQSVPAIHIPSGKLRRYFSLRNVVDLLVVLPLGFVKAGLVVWWLMPDVIVSKGGYGSIPVVLVGLLLRIPILLHDSDITPGLTNRLLARAATTLALGFSEAKQAWSVYAKKTLVTGIPVRTSLGSVTKEEGLDFFQLQGDKPVILVFGGSQGAQQLNEVLLQVLPQIITEATVLHITGTQHYKAVSTVAQELLTSAPRKSAYRAYPELSREMSLAYAAADIVVARAGATTLAELSCLGKASLLVPLANAAGDHQRRNAAMFERAGAAIVLDPDNLGRSLFHRTLEQLIRDNDKRQLLGQRIHNMYRSGAARSLAEISIKLASGYEPRMTKV